MKEIYLIRHTTPNIEKGICYGNTDIDTNGEFINEATSIEKILTDIKVNNIFSSPLKRCSKLAQFLFTNHAINYDDRLKELNFGDWEDKPWQDIDKETLKIWSEDFMNLSPPNGESFLKLYNRTLSSLEEITDSIADNETTAIVTHSGIIRCLLMKYLEIPADKIFSWQLNFGAIIKITLHSEDYNQIQVIKG